MRCIALLLLLAIAQSTSISPDSFRCPTPKLKNGRIRARGRGRIIRYSCYPGYELVGNKYSTCIRGSWDTATPICVSTRCPSMPVPRHMVVGEKYRGAILMYFCEPGYVLVGNAEIYCDGRQWNATTPYCRDSNAVTPTSCDFEKDGLCWWEQDPKHDFDWRRHRFDTPSSHIGTGPTHDHTLGAGYDGYYLYIEASGRLINDTARIISPLYPANLTESGCFSFWYHMYGLTIGSLNVYLKPEGEKTGKLMWTKSGNQGNQWLRGLFDLPAVNTSFQIIIEGVRGSSYISDIAIDDIALLQGEECAVKNVSTAQTTAAPDGDEVEIFNANQSCKDRCVSAETTPSSEIFSNPDACQCYVECAEEANCCPDFAEYCIYGLDADETTPSTTSRWMAVSTQASTIEHLSTGNYSETTIHPNVPASEVPIMEASTEKSKAVTEAYGTRRMEEEGNSTNQVFYTNAKLPTTEKSIETSTAKSSSAHNVTTETSFTSTKELIIAVTGRSRSFSVIIDTEMKTTKQPQLAGSTILDYFTFSNNTVAKNEFQVHEQKMEKLERSANLGLPGIIGIVVSTLIGIAIAVFMAIFIFQKRRSCKRNSNGSAFAEDSDVRYLTSDEVLDFNLAKPADEHEET